MTQGTIIPPEVDQDSIEYGHVYANYVKSVADTPADEDANPDIVRVNGQVSFDSTFPGASARGSIRLPANPRAYGLIVTGDTFEITNSKLVDHEGREGVRLIASVDGIPLSWQAVVTLQDSSGRTIYNKSYIIHHDLWDSSGELLRINLPDLIPTPSRLEPPEGAAVRAAESAIEEIEALTQTNQQINIDVEGLKSEVVTLHGQTGQRLTAAEAARDAAQTARTGAESARTGAEAARDTANNHRVASQTARTGAESARDTAQTARTGAESARDAAAGSESAAAASAGAAGTQATLAGERADDAGLARDAASGSATAAAGSASDASSSASSAAGSATDSEAARDAAVVARTGAEAARSGAEDARATSVTKAGEASDSAAAALTAKEGAEAARATSVTKAGEASDSAAAAANAKDEAEAARATSVTKAGEASDSAAAAQTLHDDVAAAVAQFDVDFAADMALFTGIRDEINLVANDVAEDANRAEDAAQATEDALTVVRAHRWVPQGQWESDLTYSAGDVVAYDGGSYYAQEDIPAGTEPPGGNWMMLGGGGITDAAELTGALTEYVDSSRTTVNLGSYVPGVAPDLQVVQLVAILGYLYQALDSSVEASRVTGALTDQVDASDATVPDPNANFETQYPLGTFVEQLFTGLNDLSAAVSDKSDVGHSHAWSEVTSKPSVFPPESHDHAIADVSGLQAALDDTAADWDDLSGKPATFPPASHSHSWGSITSKPTEFPPESHTHTKGEVGLANVDNTSDVDKPVSTATQQALNSKSDDGHTHSPGEVGLGNVDNTADADKPVSSAQRSAIDARPAMWLWDGSDTWTPPAAANSGDSVLRLDTGEIHSVTEV